jgi:hypothetical protein
MAEGAVVSIYDGQALLGTVKKVGRVHVVRTPDDRVLAKFATRREAVASLSKPRRHHEQVARHEPEATKIGGDE